jgi:hypothetical protein
MFKRAFFFLFLFLLVIGFQFAYAQKNSTPFLIKWVVQKGGSLKVDGSTNINKFSCKIADYSLPDTIAIYKNNNVKDVILPMTGRLALDIGSFNCGNPIMTSDLRKTLKAKEFPKLYISFISLSKIPEANKINGDITGWVDIELAGVKKRFLVNYIFSSASNQSFHLTGTKSINFSDFNLTPPRKLGGMIKANEKLDVEFQLNLWLIN